VTISKRVVLFSIRIFCKVFLSCEVRGKRNVPGDGPLVLVSNHVHNIDVILLPYSFPRWINFMAKQELFNIPVLGFLIRWTGAFPIFRQGVIGDKRETMRQAIAILEGGGVLGMFPEGKRNSSGVLLRGKAGPAVIASEAAAPLIPVAISGVEKLRGISWLWKRPRIIISIGEPFTLSASEGRLRRSEMKSLTDLMMNKIAMLLPEAKRGIYGG
jgi:1-acyl-sn-glycerol-3-phosphate acyltransferase